MADSTQPDTVEPDAFVDATAGRAPRTYPTIAAALEAAPDAASRPWTILLRPGEYREKLTITKANIHLVGSGKDHTRIVFDAFAGQTKPDGKGQWGTSGSATLTIKAADFSARHLTIANDFDFLGNDARDPGSANRVGASQAVAVFVSSGSDRCLFEDVALNGYQDTLFVDAGRSLFVNCSVRGNVDFIFGSGTALFESCDIISRPRAHPDTLPAGFVVAPSTSKDRRFGLVFRHCHLKRETPNQPAGSHFLGRPWHPTREFADGRYADPNAIGHAAFIECVMDDHIAGGGWTAMSGTARDGQKQWFQPLADARFFEYQTTGAGAGKNSDRPQLSEIDASGYTRASILGDWQPQAG